MVYALVSGYWLEAYNPPDVMGMEIAENSPKSYDNAGGRAIRSHYTLILDVGMDRDIQVNINVRSLRTSDLDLRYLFVRNLKNDVKFNIVLAIIESLDQNDRVKILCQEEALFYDDLFDLNEMIPIDTASLRGRPSC